MTLKSATVAFLMVVGSTYTVYSQATNLTGPYLGQVPPKSEPQKFAPDVVSTDRYTYGGTFTPDMKAFYFLRDSGTDEGLEFVVFENIENQWKESVISKPVGQPMVAPNGDLMHLGKRFKLKTQEGWSEVKQLGEYFEPFRIMRMTSSLAETYVFDEVGSEDGDGVIRYSRLINGKREKPRAFSEVVNTGTFNAHPFIAPDESYLLWDSRRKSGFGGSDIYISFKQYDGSWGRAINLGPKINTDGWDAAASVTPDGKYLIFHRLNDAGNANIFWVDASIIEQFRNRSHSELRPKVNITTANGSSNELKVKSDLEYLHKQYDLTPYLYTKKIQVDEKARAPYSHPVLTMSTQPEYISSKTKLLSSYLHEQFHWHVVMNGKPEKEAFRSRIKEFFPNIQIGHPFGSSDAGGTLSHIIVCYLEYIALSELIGEKKALENISTNGYYTLVYDTVIDQDNREVLDALLVEFGLEYREKLP
ncbi:hypothetical protein DRW07_09040 [Alteromonas sediminis]|uniref:Uncharacterized protein n=1 Tax=Alteromonas sediminis TaxID=2259342 RepID=A0A3N5Z9E7_9ALTE|nr:PD40 domain-containing protein [Alteromonas sediminis]RPJ67644.1 hypothetical protein DRW07_09040 [Alteromonas sediminis]